MVVCPFDSYHFLDTNPAFFLFFFLCVKILHCCEFLEILCWKFKFCVKKSPKVEKTIQIFKENGQIFVYLVEVGSKKI
jgi:hypothetical protein